MTDPAVVVERSRQAVRLVVTAGPLRFQAFKGKIRHAVVVFELWRFGVTVTSEAELAVENE